MEILKVSAKSNPNSVAGALAGVLRERGDAEIQAIGAGALNQAIKSVAIARGFVAPGGIGSSTLVRPKSKSFNLATHWKMVFFYEIFCQI